MSKHAEPLRLEDFDFLAAVSGIEYEQAAELRRRLTNGGIPPEAQRAPLDELCLVLTGIRVAVAHWYPRPALQDEHERDTLLRTLEDIVAKEVDRLAAQVIDRYAAVIARTRSRLMNWNAERPIIEQIRPTREQAALLNGRKPVDYDSVQWETLPDGRTIPHYNVQERP